MLDDLLDRLEGVRRSGAGWTARCPGHDDRRASLSVGRGDDGRWLLKCHAGCPFDAILAALGVDARELFPANRREPPPGRRIVAVYDYDGVFEVVRYAPKDFRQRRRNGRRGYVWNLDGVTPRLYRLNDLAGRESVLVAEGEKDVDRLWALDLPATCNAGGAGQWRAAHSEQLKAAGVRRAVPDADEAGRTHGQAVARACVAAGMRVKVAALPAGVKDVSAYLDAGRGRDELVGLVKAAEPYEPVAALPAGVVRLSDAAIDGTAAAGPPAVARLLAHVGRVTLLHAREKAGKSTLIGAAVAAVTRGRPFLGMPTVAGDVLWVGEEAVGDVKARLWQWEADLERVYFTRRPSPDPEHDSSLRRLVARLHPVWVILDTWSHYLKVHRVKDTAGPGEQGLLIGDVVDLAREYGTAVALAHHNRKNPSAAAESGDAAGEYRDSTAIGAAVDMIVSVSRARAPRARRLTPSGRWTEDPLTVVLEPGAGYELTTDLRAALDALLDAGHIDHALRAGAATRRARGYALTPEGRRRAEALRGHCVSVSAFPPPGAGGNGNGNRYGTARPATGTEPPAGDADGNTDDKYRV